MRNRVSNTKTITAVSIAAVIVTILVTGLYFWNVNQQAVRQEAEAARSQAVSTFHDSLSDVVKRHEQLMAMSLDEDVTSRDMSKVIELIDQQLDHLDQLNSSINDVELLAEQSKQVAAEVSDIKNDYQLLKKRQKIYRDAEVAFESYKNSTKQPEDYKKMVDKVADITARLNNADFTRDSDKKIAAAYKRLRDTYHEAVNTSSEAAYDRHDKVFAQITGPLGDQLDKDDEKFMADLQTKIKHLSDIVK